MVSNCLLGNVVTLCTYRSSPNFPTKRNVAYDVIVRSTASYRFLAYKIITFFVCALSIILTMVFKFIMKQYEKADVQL